MIIQCAWCKELQGERAPLDDMSVTHSLCPKCFKIQMDQIKKYKEERDKKKPQKNPSRRRRQYA